MAPPSLPLHKEHPDLPDSYSVKIDYMNGKSETLEVAKHIVVDKIFMFDDKGKMVSWEPHTSPFVEFQLTDDTYKTVPMANASFHYDKSWTKIVEIRKTLKKELDDKKGLDS